MNVLIVDDNNDDRKVLRYLVEKHGHVAIEAVNGLDGLHKAKGKAPDLIISDALMPTMDGFQFLHAVKQEADLRGIPFIFYSSSYRKDKDVQLAMSLGANAYVFKPVDPVELWAKIEEILRAETKDTILPAQPVGEDADYLKRYCEVVATKLEEKVRELERAMEALQKSERRKTILNQIATIFLTVPDDEMYGQVLQVVLEVMKSRFGIFGFIAENGDLVMPSMSEDIWDQCQTAGKTKVFPSSTWGNSLWGRAIREKKTLSSDGPFHTPAGHIHINHFLTVPIVMGHETIGLISVANGERSYNGEDQDLLENIANSISPILEARRQRDWQEQKRLRAEENLRKLSRAVEQSPVSIIITNATGTIEYINPKFTEVTGYSLAEALGQNPRLLKSGKTPIENYRQLWQTISSGKEWRGELHNRKKTGELYWELASISPIFDATGSITHFVAVKEDITERRRLEEEIRQAQKLEAVGQLAGGVAHDFNNILAAILMNLRLLQDESQLTAELRAGLQELEVEAHRASSLTRQLLLFSRRQALDAKPLDLNEVVLNMARMLRRLIGEDIDLVFQGQSSSSWIMADAGMMDQVVMNLCVNARDAMPQGGQLTIGIRQVEFAAESAITHPHNQASSFICLSVTDTGCGMEEEVQKHIFEPFFTTKEVGKGTGLGLATVYGIVNQHRGWIQVHSTVGKGTTFEVYLPVFPVEKENGAKVEEAEIRGGTETILVVEDDPSIRRLVALGLRKLGYAILESANGVDALKVWEQHQQQTDLLLTDMVMPKGLTGLDLAERLMQQKKSLKVIITSGYSPDKARTETLAASGITYLAKPFDTVVLARTVRACLDQELNQNSDR